MKKKILVVSILGMFLLVSMSVTGLKSITNKVTPKNDDYIDYLSVMRSTPETLEKWEEDYNNAELAFINPSLSEIIEATSEFSILHLLDYIPEENNQGRCANCWAWPATSILGIALNVQLGIFDRLSVQYINTCGEEYSTFPPIGCCEPGNLAGFASFYRATDMAIPWSNTFAHWHDGGNIRCITPCSIISKVPNYPIYDIHSKTIKTRGVPEEEAISNIKNILHQNRGVYFTILFPDNANLQNFGNFWRNQNEQYIYDIDYYCGSPIVEDEGGGHAVLCVGYNDVEGTENDYWIMLNSWGTNSNRPTCVFLVEMHFDYECKYSNFYAFGAQTLSLTFNPDAEAPEPPSIDGPSTGQPDTEYTYQLSAIDTQGDDVFLYVDWGDNTNTGWAGPYYSGEQIEVNHTWSKRGLYTISAKAKDTKGKVSAWTTLKVSMPKNKAINRPILNFLEQHPNLFPLLRQLLQKL